MAGVRGGEAPAVESEQELHLRIYRTMLLARRMDERQWQLNRQGLAHFAVPCSGHEAVGVGYASQLEPGRDWYAPHYRDLSALLWMGVTPREVMAHFLARRSDPHSGGRQLYAHWSHPPTLLPTLSSPQPNHLLRAVGIALVLKGQGEGRVILCAFGEGSSSRGDFHEGLNFAAIHDLPIIFLCENNLYTITVSAELQLSHPDVARRADGYGIPGVIVDGMDPLEVGAAVGQAVERARRGRGPSLIEAKTYRYLPHTSNDDDRRYRAPEEVERWREKDPLPRFRQRLISAGSVEEDELASVEREVRTEVEEAIEWALAQPEPEAEELYTHIYDPATAFDPRA